MLTVSCFLMAGCDLIRDKPIIVQSGCDWTKIITASPKDTDETKRQILAHDREHKKHCG